MSEGEKKEENSFRNIMKGTSIFGGVQIFNILISAIRIKFVAVILGPSGMGVAGLFNTASLTIQNFASLGLNLSIVKEIGQNKEDNTKLANVVTSIRPLILLSAAIGALICLLFPTLLSSLTFGNTDHSFGFLMLSAAVFFSVAGGVFMSVLQGLHAIKSLSKATLIGSIVGLTVGVPLYWLLGTNGIVPAMIVLSLSTCCWYFFSLRKTQRISTTPWDREIHLPILKKILTMGIILMSNDLFISLVNYLVNVFIRSHGGMDEVVFYQSCNSMTSQYSAIVFAAMAMDYLPRLSAVSGNNEKMCEVVNRQMEVVGLLIAPIACAVIFFAPLVIKIFQTSSFLVATPLLRLLALSVVIRALMYPLGYIVFAKDNRRLFFWMESVGANLLTLCLTCSGYFIFGLSGLGYAAIIDCAICLCVYIAVNYRLYHYQLSGAAAKIILFSLFSAVAMSAICFALEGIAMLITASIVLVIVSVVALRLLILRMKK